jgi:large subunit ribosomal protein L6
MSRIGKLPITLPNKVTISVDKENIVTVKGPLGELKQKIDPDITVGIEDSIVTVVRPTEQKRHKALHGLSRALINNMVFGVSEGYTVKQEIVGVGYRVSHQGQVLEFSLGYSHQIVFQVPNEITVDTKTERGSNPQIFLKSYDKQLIGQVAAKIRSFRKPEPYKGKGIKFVGEQLRRKAGKSSGKK